MSTCFLNESSSCIRFLSVCKLTSFLCNSELSLSETKLYQCLLHVLTTAMSLHR